MANTTPAKGVDFIIGSKRPYPEWIKTHSVFKEFNKIDKIFPRIGLPNFRESCDIMNSAEALSYATQLGNKIRSELNNIQKATYLLLDAALKSTEKNRNEACNKLQSLVNLSNTVSYSLGFGDYAKVIDGKIVMRLRADIFSGENKNPIFRKDEAVLRIFNKIKDICTELNVKVSDINQWAEFKEFSRTNVPNKKYTVVFSSSGDDGAWDISTISMRGITSCQGWSAPQSRGLIGSISSKFVGVIYLASDQEIPGYGSKMLNRSMVRFCVHQKTKKPALIMDNMYPSANADTLTAFKKILKEKSGLDVWYINDTGAGINQYYIPDEPSRKLLKQGEASYMDHQIVYQPHIPSLNKTVTKEMSSLTDDFKKIVGEELDNMVKAKRDLYNDAMKQLEKLTAEYNALKTKWEKDNDGVPEEQRKPFNLEEPKMDAELFEFFRGGIENLFVHCDKKHAGSAGKTFANLILNSFVLPENCASKEEFHRKYLMGFLKNPKSVKEDALKVFAKGTWIKSFPKSGEKFFNYVFSQMRGYVIGACKEIIKKSN